MLKVYSYQNCGTCKKAIKFLDQHGVSYKLFAIRETAPSKAELKEMLKSMGSLKKLFNTSGQDYRALGLKDKIDHMSEGEALELLHGNGNLVKRPFVYSPEFKTVGFKEDHWLKELL